MILISRLNGITSKPPACSPAMLFACSTGEPWIGPWCRAEVWNKHEAVQSSLCDFQNRSPLHSCCLLQGKINGKGWVLCCGTTAHCFLRGWSHITGKNPSLYLPLVPEPSTHGQEVQSSHGNNLFCHLHRHAFFFACCTGRRTKGLRIWQSKYMPALNRGTCAKTG